MSRELEEVERSALGARSILDILTSEIYQVPSHDIYSKTQSGPRSNIKFAALLFIKTNFTPAHLPPLLLFLLLLLMGVVSGSLVVVVGIIMQNK